MKEKWHLAPVLGRPKGRKFSSHCIDASLGNNARHGNFWVAFFGQFSPSSDLPDKSGDGTGSDYFNPALP